jgi:hypothetical protein
MNDIDDSTYFAVERNRAQKLAKDAETHALGVSDSERSS